MVKLEIVSTQQQKAYVVLQEYVTGSLQPKPANCCSDAAPNYLHAVHKLAVHNRDHNTATEDVGSAGQCVPT